MNELEFWLEVFKAASSWHKEIHGDGGPKWRRYDFADCCDQADKALKRAIATIEGGHVDPPQIELSATQAADLARVSYSALLGELRRGSIPNRRVGNRYRIRVADLVMWIRRQR